MIVLGIDPGPQSTSWALVRKRPDGLADLLDLGHEPSPSRILDSLRAALEAYAHGRIMPEVVVIEFPSPRWFKRANQASVLQTAWIAAQTALGLRDCTGLKVELMDADQLRHRGRVLANRLRPHMFRRLFGEVEATEHQVDAALLAAKYMGLF